MTSVRGTLLVSAALLFGSMVGAEAADINYGGSIKDGGYAAPIVAPEPRLYFRVDGGYAFHDDPVMVENGIYDLTDTSIDDTWTVGGGIGIYFSRNVRADITVDHRFEADTQGNLRDHAATLEGVRAFGLSSTVALANVYYDFDTRSRFTPYVGVGLGFVRHSTKTGTVLNPCGGCTGVVEGDSSTHVAGALMAGVSVNLTGGRGHNVSSAVNSGPHHGQTASRDLLLDIGYRFLYLGETATGPVRFTLPGPAVSEDPTVESIHAHEFRVGLRYNVR
ncbi:MAG: porin [Hyphomicrobium sp.]|nr:MAG: porin [Hyphomicrobium sp.]